LSALFDLEADDYLLPFFFFLLGLDYFFDAFFESALFDFDDEDCFFFF
jgi:hypothetical protein